MFRRAIATALTPFVRFALRFLPIPDPWERLQSRAPLRFFGSGARNDFAWYFEGESAVAVATLDEVHAWLAECRYASDAEVFHERDFWQHPRTFERLRAGDCEDYALWAWRKLVELGYDADFVAGRVPKENDPFARHAWIVFRREGVEYVYEPTCGDYANAIRPVDEVRALYIPEVGVGRDRVRFGYCGFLITMRDWSPRKHRRVGEARA